MEAVKRKPRNFIPENFVVENWEQLLPYFEQLFLQEIATEESLLTWLKNRSELESAVDEDYRWRYIRLTCDINSEEIKQAHEYFVTEIQPHLIEYREKLNKKFISHPLSQKLDNQEYGTLINGINNSLKLHEEENIELLTALELKQQEYQGISGNMTIQYKGNEYTLPQAVNFLYENDRTVREEVYHLIAQRRLDDKEKLNDLYSDLIQKRNELATKAGFSNYRDYKFTELNRNDYTADDCFQFHEAIKKEVLPLYEIFLNDKKKALGVDTLRPWDVDVIEGNQQPLKPFTDGDDLIQKTTACFNEIRPFFADCLQVMKTMGHLDLESRKGKAPGGYNMTMPEIGVPFIFMNAASSLSDMVTMLHEGGHAIHSFLSKDLALKEFKDVPSEIAEVASMSMELISMEHWKIFFENKEDLRHAKQQQIKRVIHILPWVATIDKFQHWVYTNPNHTLEQRKTEWTKIFFEFSSSAIDYSGLEENIAYRWQSQLHLFEVPFYYIEYAIAQLGAIAMWKQYKEQGDLAIDNYIKALSLGYSKSLPELYKAAGIKFDFSQNYISELVKFLKKEYEALH